MATKKQWQDYLKALRQYKREKINKEIETIEDLLDSHSEDDADDDFDGPGSNPPPPPPPPPRP